MPTARIEIEHVNKNWVIQVEASSILRSDRKTIYANTIEEAFATALTVYHEMEAKVRPQDEGKPRELTPELAEAVARFNAAQAVTDLAGDEPDPDAVIVQPVSITEPDPEASNVREVSVDEVREKFPSALAKAIKENVIDGPRFIVTPDAPTSEQPTLSYPKGFTGDRTLAEQAEEQNPSPKPLRGRHPKTCECGKCVAKRAA